MHTDLVVTFSGPDRPGIVDSLASRIRDHGGNWEESRLMRLAGMFCGMLLVRVPVSKAGELESALADTSQDLTVHVTRGAKQDRSLESLSLSLSCADRNGIIHDLTHALAAHRANIEELNSSVTSAPMSGEPLFSATVRVSMPHELGVDGVVAAIEGMQSDLLVEVVD